MLNPMPKLSHYDARGKARMVDVTRKSVTHRTATAHAFVYMSPRVVAAIRKLKNPKGDPLETARIAGITAASALPSGYLFVIHSRSLTLMCFPPCAKMASRFALTFPPPPRPALKWRRSWLLPLPR